METGRREQTRNRIINNTIEIVFLIFILFSLFNWLSKGDNMDKLVRFENSMSK